VGETPPWVQIPPSPPHLQSPVFHFKTVDYIAEPVWRSVRVAPRDPSRARLPFGYGMAEKIGYVIVVDI
jgi:hypothetical protein